MKKTKEMTKSEIEELIEKGVIEEKDDILRPLYVNVKIAKLIKNRTTVELIDGKKVEVFVSSKIKYLDEFRVFDVKAKYDGVEYTFEYVDNSIVLAETGRKDYNVKCGEIRPYDFIVGDEESLAKANRILGVQTQIIGILIVMLRDAEKGLDD